MVGLLDKRCIPLFDLSYNERSHDIWIHFIIFLPILYLNPNFTFVSFLHLLDTINCFSSSVLLIFSCAYISYVCTSRVCFAWIPAKELPPGMLSCMNTSKTLNLYPDSLTFMAKVSIVICVEFMGFDSARNACFLIFFNDFGLSHFFFLFFLNLCAY